MRCCSITHWEGVGMLYCKIFLSPRPRVLLWNVLNDTWTNSANMSLFPSMCRLDNQRGKRQATKGEDWLNDEVLTNHRLE